MLSNLRTIFKSNPAKSGSPQQATEPSAEVRQAGGANAFLAQIMPPPPASFGPGAGKHTTRTVRANERLMLEAERPLPPAVAPLLFPVGLVTGDGSARFSREGFLLPIEAGKLPARYLADPHSLTLDATVARWRDLLIRRAHSLADAGVAFSGALLPDKLTLLADYFPEPIVVPPALMAGVELMIAGELGLAGAVDPILPLLRADPAMTEIYRRIDPGLTPYGNWQLFQILISRLGHAAGIKLNFSARKLVRPVAGDHFFDVPMFEEIHETDSAVVMRYASTVETLPAREGYDEWQSWRNEQAPIDQIIVLYGDPMLGSFELGQCALAWWFACFFREVRVSHMSKYDHSFVMDYPPDAAIFVITEEGIEGPPLV